MTEIVIANLSDVQGGGGGGITGFSLTGDVTGTYASGSVPTTIAANAVTYAKLQAVGASKLLGNPSGASANASEITLGATLSFSGSALQTAALTGDVTAAANSFATTVAKIQGQAVSATAPTSNQCLQWSGTAWTPTSQPFDVSSYSGGGVLTASQNLQRVTFARQVIFPANLTGSQATADAAATASTVLTISRAPAATPNTFSSIGTITFGAGSATATFTFTASVTFAAGDVLRIQGPGTPDATLAGVSVTLAGTR